MQPAYLSPHNAGDAQYCTIRHPHRQGRSTITGGFNHLSEQQGSHSIIHSTNHGIPTVRTGTNSLNATGMELQDIPSTMKRVFAANMTILLQASKIIHYNQPPKTSDSTCEKVTLTFFP